jgi:hypothetical protein
MDASAWVAAVSAIIALVALWVSWDTASKARQTVTSDFQAAEKVKLDTAVLIAVLRSLALKGVIYSQQPPERRDDPDFEQFVDNEAERSAIGAFIQSPTAIAYHTFAAGKSKEARLAGRTGEAWRLFFLMLSELQLTKNPWAAAQRAAALESQLDSLDRSGFRAIADNLQNLAESFETMYAARSNDPLFAALLEMHDSVEADNRTGDDGISQEEFPLFVHFLRTVKKVDDPDIDMWDGLATEDAHLLESALTRGAAVSVTDRQVIDRYSDAIAEFRRWTAERSPAT